jgi:hypothetical protein
MLLSIIDGGKNLQEAKEIVYWTVDKPWVALQRGWIDEKWQDTNLNFWPSKVKSIITNPAKDEYLKRRSIGGNKVWKK